MIVSIGSDHAGFQLKVKMLPILKQWGYEVLDSGCFDDKEKVYFPDVARAVCQPVLDGPHLRPRADRRGRWQRLCLRPLC